MGLLISDYFRYQLDKSLAEEIMKTILEYPDKQVVFVGNHSYSSNEVWLKGETLGTSFF